MKVGIIIGSLRKDSFNRKIAEVLKSLSSKLEMEIVEISELSLFNQDLEEHPPKAWVDFREAIKAQDAILFVTPEYNRSVPAALKNALDVGSRPYGQSVWDGKPCALVSAAASQAGGFGANHHLRQCFVFLNMLCMQQPEMYLSKVHELFDEKGALKEDTRAFLAKFMGAFELWLSKQLPS